MKTILSLHYQHILILLILLALLSAFVAFIYWIFKPRRKNKLKKSFKSRLTFEFYVFINSVVQIFSCITKDIIDSILNMNKKYHWLIGAFLYLLINSIIPLYYLFIGI